MPIELIVFILILVGTHYLTYMIGEDASDARWRKYLREIELQKLMEERERRAEAVERTLLVKTSTPRARKVAVKKK